MRILASIFIHEMYSSSGISSHIFHHASCMNHRVGISFLVLTIHHVGSDTSGSTSSIASKSEYFSLQLKSFIASSSVINVYLFIHHVLILHELVVPVFLSFSVHLFTDYNEYVRQVHYLLRTFPCPLSVRMMKYDDCYIQLLC